MKATVKFTAKKSGCSGVRRKVKSNGEVKLTINEGKLLGYLNDQNDVIFVSDKTGKPILRVFTLIKPDGTPYYSSQTMHPFLEAAAKMNVEMEMNGNTYIGDEAKKTLHEAYLANRKSHPRICVTPDRIINCNVCGNEIRIGKYLCDHK